jgi:hypothetical protein
LHERGRKHIGAAFSSKALRLQNIQTELDVWNLFSSPDSIHTIQKLDLHSKPKKLGMSTMQQPNYKVEKLSKRKWVLKWQTGKQRLKRNFQSSIPIVT